MSNSIVKINTPKHAINKAINQLFLMMFGLIACFSAIAQAATAPPTIMIIMHEKVAGVFGTTGYEQPNQAELTLMEKFNELDFKVVDPSTVKRNLTRAQGLRFLEGNDAAAAVHGLQHGADISIIGSVISKPSGGKLYGTRMQTIQATLTARAIRNDDARVIATASSSATQAHIDEVQGGVLAIEKAATELAEDLAAKLSAKWQAKQQRSAPNEVKLLITGLVSFRHLDFVMGFFEKEVKGVKRVHLRNFSEGVADIELDYRGEIRKLARRIANKKFKGFRLEPTNVSSNSIDMAVVIDKR